MFNFLQLIYDDAETLHHACSITFKSARLLTRSCAVVKACPQVPHLHLALLRLTGFTMSGLSGPFSLEP